MATLEEKKLIEKFLNVKVTLLSEKEVKAVQNFEKTCNTKVLKYNEDWNLLMKVVEKIESVLMPETDNCFNVCIGPGLYCTIQDSYGDLIEINHSSKKKIKAVYKACVEFIKWYNLNKNQYE